MTTLAAPRAATIGREPAVGGEQLPLWPIRGAMLVALAAFAGLHWMLLLEPAAPGRAWEALGIVVLVILGLLGASRLPGGLRFLAAIAVAIAALALALLAGGAADEYLRPDRWSVLLTGVGRGVEALPGVRVPYRGVDEWTRLVIGTGGTLLMVLGALLAFWPRRGTRRAGFPVLAVVALVALYAVPAVVLNVESEFLRGAILALLMLGFLWLEKLRVSDAKAGAVVAAAAAIAGLVAAPALDGREPWFDYETWAVETAGTRAVTFSWDHDYSPLEWPRDGREMLRVKARLASYWKARDLDMFDGRTWRADPRPSGVDASAYLPESEASVARWSQRIEVTLRNLKSDTFVTAGVATGVEGEAAFPAGDGVFISPTGLGRGDSYAAEVYTPRPADRQLREAPPEYSEFLRQFRTSYLALLPEGLGSDPEDTMRVGFRVEWPAWQADPTPTIERFGTSQRAQDRLLRQAGMSRMWALAKRFREEAETPFEYVQLVEAYLADGFGYSETPPRTAGTLDGFLFDAKVGFCQQFSGAEALLLRMGGIPARVATGFTSGSFDEKQKEYVVRDLDAHSWVEAWFHGYGWVTRDPTPTAAPPRSQPGEDRAGAAVGRIPGAPDLGGERLGDLESGRQRATGDDSTATTLRVGGVLAAITLVGGGLLESRRRRRLPPPAQRPMVEFERALRRARIDGGAGRTLSSIEREYSGWPGAVGYIRALRDQRYSARPAAPTPEQRRGLRAALARDAGLLRAWWALPPRRS
jgi:protein-glutamine gamma-glutamyltransferase